MVPILGQSGKEANWYALDSGLHRWDRRIAGREAVALETTPTGIVCGMRKRPHAICATGRNAIFCTFGGGVRQVNLDVLYCTDYRNRNAPPRLVQIGFAPQVRGAEMEA